MNLDGNERPTFGDRCFAALFSAIAAGITYAVWVFFHAGQWGPEQIQDFKELGKWIVLAGGILGFAGGLSLVGGLWATIWETRNQALISLPTALVLIVLFALVYWGVKA